MHASIHLAFSDMPLYGEAPGAFERGSISFRQVPQDFCAVRSVLLSMFLFGAHMILTHSFLKPAEKNWTHALQTFWRYLDLRDDLEYEVC